MSVVNGPRGWAGGFGALAVATWKMALQIAQRVEKGQTVLTLPVRETESGNLDLMIRMKKNGNRHAEMQINMGMEACESILQHLLYLPPTKLSELQESGVPCVMADLVCEVASAYAVPMLRLIASHDANAFQGDVVVMVQKTSVRKPVCSNSKTPPAKTQALEEDYSVLEELLAQVAWCCPKQHFLLPCCQHP